MSLLDSLFNHFSAQQMSQMNFEHSKALQSHQFKLNRRALKEYYTNNRKSLVKAGYNPLLAVPGSTAQGFSANASMNSSPASASGIGTDEVNAVSSALSAKEQRKVAKQQVESIKQDVVHKKLENKKLKNEINTNPRTVISELITNGNSNTGNSALSYLSKLKNKYGLGFIQPRSYIQTNLGRLQKAVNLFGKVHSAVSSKLNRNAQQKLFELKATYNDYKNNSGDIGVWNSKNRHKGRILSDDEVNSLSKKRNKINKYSKPPKSFPR